MVRTFGSEKEHNYLRDVLAEGVLSFGGEGQWLNGRVELIWISWGKFVKERVENTFVLLKEVV